MNSGHFSVIPSEQLSREHGEGGVKRGGFRNRQTDSSSPGVEQGQMLLCYSGKLIPARNFYMKAEIEEQEEVEQVQSLLCD